MAVPAPGKPLPHFITIKDAARITGMHQRYYYELIKAGKGPPILWFGRVMRLRYADFIKWAETRTERGQRSRQPKAPHHV